MAIPIPTKDQVLGDGFHYVYEIDQYSNSGKTHYGVIVACGIYPTVRAHDVVLFQKNYDDMTDQEKEHYKEAIEEAYKHRVGLYVEHNEYLLKVPKYIEANLHVLTFPLYVFKNIGECMRISTLSAEAIYPHETLTTINTLEQFKELLSCEQTHILYALKNGAASCGWHLSSIVKHEINKLDL